MGVSISSSTRRPKWYGTSLNYCATLGLENPMENVQVCDLMCYCATFGELHIFKIPLV